MENNIMDRVMEITDKGLREKIEQEVLDAHRRAEKDREVVERAVKLIQDGLMYKDFGQGSYHHYVLATTEMFFEDFMKTSQHHWDRGIKFTVPEDRNNYSGVFSVNGQRYFDMRYLLDKYTKDVEAEMRSICRYNERLQEIKHAFNDLVRQAPALEKMLKEWTAAQEAKEAASDD